MEKKQIKEYLKKRVGIFPEDIITARPEGMSYKDYKTERTRVNACLKDYLAVGRMVHVVSKGMYAVDPKTNRPFMYGIDTEKHLAGSPNRTLGIPYVNEAKRTKRVAERAKYRPY